MTYEVLSNILCSFSLQNVKNLFFYEPSAMACRGDGGNENK